jgi:hypothetical protein
MSSDGKIQNQNESLTFIMPMGGGGGGGGGDEDVKGAPKYFRELKGGFWKFSIYWRGGAINFSKFWSSRGLECSLPRGSW